MKYSMLSAVAVLAATSLGFPEFYWRGQSSPGRVFITNNLNTRVGLRPEPDNSLAHGAKILSNKDIIINSHDTIIVPASASSKDLKLRALPENQNQVEVSYTSGDRDTYNYAIKSTEVDRFPGAVYVCTQPPQCPGSVLYPGQQETRQVTCKNGVALHVYLQDPRLPPPCQVQYDNEYDDGWY